MNSPVNKAIALLVQAIHTEEREALLNELVTAARSKVSEAGARVLGIPTARARRARRSKGEKRSPKEISGRTVALLQAIKKEPGRNIEALAKALGCATKELMLPVARLRKGKQIRTRGTRRGMRYFPTAAGREKRP